MNKKVSFSKPKTKGKTVSVDEWVDKREAEPIKRLTIDIPESLHREIKSQCAARGAKIVDEVRELLIQKYRK